MQFSYTRAWRNLLFVCSISTPRRDPYLLYYTSVYVIVNSAYLLTMLLARPLPLVSYLIYIGVVVFIIIFLPKVDNDIKIK